ncbi:ATP-binding protein [Desulfonema magnum]|uniref:P-loop containing n=1 Tax=Desulfonema magnum TaxID=45655 RepID=A0A975BP18_9BACT|nr:ATP-binding protein [Desulfonema magnum]QTA88539.1 p-loop containing [Desulfonema magnum]
MTLNDFDEQSSLILAAEDYPPETFSDYHRFTAYDKRFISKLAAHGPVLLRGGRGSGKSALMIEASRQLAPYKKDASAFGVYISLRHLELLRKEGRAYEKVLCRLLIDRVRECLGEMSVSFDPEPSVSSVQTELSKLTIKLKSRLVLFFDDAAHIGREAPLEAFFDIFRTLSSSTVSCKAAIYPGVTKFGTRFDVYNDATVLEISRNEELAGYDELFAEIIRLRFPQFFSGNMPVTDLDFIKFAGFLGRAVLGNMRAFIFACNALSERCADNAKIGVSNLGAVLLSLCGNYYWPLLEELKPKLGKHELMIEPAINIAEIMFGICGKRERRSAIIHRNIINKLAKPFEMLEYAGFISRRDVSRAMKSGGRGSRFVLSLCVLLENTPGTRLTNNLFQQWSTEHDEPAEFHRGSEINTIELPELPDSADLSVINKSVRELAKSKIYPYGLTEQKIQLLIEAGIETIGDLISANDKQLLSLKSVGSQTLERFRSVAAQAIWM